MIRSAPPWLRFDGLIAGASFASGDTVVAGCWRASPFEAFVDLMWARPDGTRVLVGADGAALDFVWSHYWFEERLVSDAGVRVDNLGLRVSGGPVSLEIAFAPPGALSSLLALRPRIMRGWGPWMWIEDEAYRPAIAPLIGGASVRTRGVTRSGAIERYAIHDLRIARSVRASVGGVDIGPVVRPVAPARFGFSEFPARPGAVRVTTSIQARSNPRPLVNRPFRDVVLAHPRAVHAGSAYPRSSGLVGGRGQR
jgi:hypothetical protein